MDDKTYLIKNENGDRFKLKIFADFNLLTININNSNSCSYSYDELVDCDTRLRAFSSIKEICSLIIFLIEKEEIEIRNKLFVLKGWKQDIIIPLKSIRQSFVVNYLQPPKLKTIINFASYDSIKSFCFLRDGRLVSGGLKGIVIYDRDTYQQDLLIQHYYPVYSVCMLRNGNLLSAGGGHEYGYEYEYKSEYSNKYDRYDYRSEAIEIYEINGNEYYVVLQLVNRHTDRVNKIIELEDGRLCSCSYDSTIIIWDNNYQPIKTLQGHSSYVNSIIEINHYIISTSAGYDTCMIVWDENTYQSIKTIKGLYCCRNNSLSKLKENTLIFGGNKEIFILDLLSFQYKTFRDDQLEIICSICVLKEDQVLLGNEEGKIICYDSLSNQIIFTEEVYHYEVCCIIKSEDNKIFSSSDEVNIMGMYSYPLI